MQAMYAESASPGASQAHRMLEIVSDCKGRDACGDTLAGDETLRFWNVLPGPKSQSTVSDSSVTTMMRTLIR